MKPFRVLGVIALLLPLAAARADGDGAKAPASPQQALQGYGLFGTASYWKQFKTGAPKYETGRWARYRAENPEQNAGSVTISVVPQKDVTTGGRRILEMKIEDAAGDRSYVKILFRGQPGDPKNVDAVLVKVPGLAPLPLPVGSKEMASRMGVEAVKLEAAAKAKVTYLGAEKVEVPLGRFDTWKYRVQARGPDGKSDEIVFWLDASGRVPIYRIVKARSSGGSLVLEAMGEGAKTDLPPFRPADIVERDQGKGSAKQK